MRPYLIPILGFAVIAGGIRDLGGGIRAVLAYARAADPVPLTPQFTVGLAAIIIGIGSVAIGYRAVRHPADVALTMLSIMVAFLTWQLVMSGVEFVFPPPVSLTDPVTTATRVLAVVDIASFIGAYFLFRAVRRWLQEHRRVQASGLGPSAV